MDMIKTITEALHKGERQRAISLLAQALQNNPRDQQAWLWLAVAHPEAARKIYCLEKVLALQAEQPSALPAAVSAPALQQALAALQRGASLQTVEHFLKQQLVARDSSVQAAQTGELLETHLPTTATASTGLAPAAADQPASAEDLPALSVEAAQDEPVLSTTASGAGALPTGAADEIAPHTAVQPPVDPVQTEIPLKIPGTTRRTALAPAARPPARRRSPGYGCLLVGLGLLALIMLAGTGLAVVRPELVQELALGLPALVHASGPAGQPVAGPAGTRRPGVTLPPTWTPTASRPASATPLPPTRAATFTPPGATALVSVTPLARGRILVIGRSVQNRPIEVYRFGRGRRERMIVAGIHGSDEQNTIVLADQLIAHLQNNPEQVPRDMTLYVLRSLNPDAEAWGSGEQGPPEQRRLNANGTDLNRNFPVGWQQTWNSVGCSSEPGTAGAYPGSEPETQSFISFLHTRHVELLVSYHSAFLGVFPSGSPAHPESARLAEAISAVAGYAYPPVRNGCEYTGTLVDWAAANGVVAAVDLELNSATDPELERNLKVLDLILSWTLPPPTPVPPTALPSSAPSITPAPPVAP